MNRSHTIRILGLVLLPALLLTTPGSAQKTTPKTKVVRPAEKFVPKFEALAETRLLMEGLSHSNYRSLHRLLKTKPTDVDTWVFARGQALIVAETGNLLLLRPPRNTGRDTWMKLAMAMRTQAGNVARNAAAKDYTRTKASLKSLTASCNKCHQTFRVAARVSPNDDMDEKDAE